MRVNARQPDYTLTDANFERLAAFIHGYCGIQITPQKRILVETRMRKRMEALGIDEADAYCSHLLDRRDNATEVICFINEITTNKTDFFREPSHFDFLANDVLPTLAGGRAKIWSAACSTGAEPYTIAMVIEDFRRSSRRLDYTILASDICTDVLYQGLSGHYPNAMLEPIPESFRRRHVMLARDPKRREFRIAPDLRAKVNFCRLNLMEPHYSVERDFDVIFCRNILIYFDQPTQHQVLAKLCGHLRPGGHLILGHSETVRGAALPLRPVPRTTIYQRLGESASPSDRGGLWSGQTVPLRATG